MAVAGGEVFELAHLAVAAEHRHERLLDVVGVHEVAHRPCPQLLARPTQQLFPRGVQQREVPVARDRRQQVAGHLEQALDARRAVERRIGARVRLCARRLGIHSC